MKKLFLFFFVVYAQNLFGAIILVNKIDPIEGRFQVYVNYSDWLSFNDLEYNQEISFDVVNERSKYLVNYKNNQISEIHLTLRQGVSQITQVSKKTDFFIEAFNKLKKENQEWNETFAKLKVSQIDFYTDKVYHIVLEKDAFGLEQIILKDQGLRSQLTDAAASSCVIL